MLEILGEGAVDVIGLGRPLAVAPDLPAGLLDGTVEAAPAPRIRSRIRKVDDALQVLWFQDQLRRMARGDEPDLGLGTTGVLMRALGAKVFSRAGRPVEATP
jgi:hypothetical protein